MKNVIFIALICIAITSCTLFPSASPTPTVTAAPLPSATTTPDPCCAEYVLMDIEEIQSLTYKFQDIAYIANFTSQAQLIDPILRLQEVRREIQYLDLPACEANVKEAIVNYMNAVIDYLAVFMGGGDTENVQSGIAKSELLWQQVLDEYNQLAETSGIEAELLPEIGKAIISIEETSTIQVSNETDQSVNVRTLPNLDASIVAKLEPGMIARGIARTETSDWIQINLDGTVGWVSADFITLNVLAEEIPVVAIDSE